MPFSNIQLMFRNNRVVCNSILLLGKHLHGTGTEVSWFCQTLARGASEAYNQDEEPWKFLNGIRIIQTPSNFSGDMVIIRINQNSLALSISCSMLHEVDLRTKYPHL